MPSNIRATVQWKDSTVFAGEEIECIITFKNTARVPEDDKQELETLGDGTGHNGSRPKLDRQRTLTQSAVNGRSTSRPRTPSIGSVRTVSNSKGHRPTLSLSVVLNASPGRTSSSTSVVPNSSAEPAKAHGRSLSIMSLGSDTARTTPPRNGPQVGSPSVGRGHGRSASMQVLSRGQSQFTPPIGYPSVRQPSPLHEANTPPLESHAADYISARMNRRRSGVNTAPNTPGFGQLSIHSPGDAINPDFKFPVEPSRSPKDSSLGPLQNLSPSDHNATTRVMPRAVSPRLSEAWPNRPAMSRVLSEASVNESTRSSSDFYSMSNHSSETVASEMPGHPGSKPLARPVHSRQQTQTLINHRGYSEEPETLMMGYAQVIGSFSLDGSLVNQAPFEEVKRKGIVGGQGGGGVVGVERSKRESGLFGAFGWGNIGESIGGLLGMDEMSSMKDMRNLANLKTIPLLSTPQSVLFVDVRLAPGESRSYSYRLRIPKGLPPSHKGRSIKVQYHMTIGVQRPGKLSEQQQVKHVDVPFRVLGSVNNDGETLGHDLMSPYILLRDEARTDSVGDNDYANVFSVTKSNGKPAKSPMSGMADFLGYTDRLLAQLPSSAPLLSPTSPTETRQSWLDAPRPSNMKECVDIAISRSNRAPDPSSEAPSQSSNRFTISRAGRPVAVLSIVRPAYRLGEAVVGKIDFCPPALDQTADGSLLPTYAIAISLVTTERIDPSLALRSASSVQRATRKVYAQVTETVLFAQETSFNLEIPATATPTFETTGVRLAWRLRVEFTTARSTLPVGQSGLGILGSEDGPEVDEPRGLLEEVNADERAKTLVAKETLLAESFEVAVPIKVYGHSVAGDSVRSSDILEV